MTLTEFRHTLLQAKPPGKQPAALAALWWAAKDDWDKAHKIVMDEPGKDCAWVHAYLHRGEGDLDNARHWYRQAGRAPASGALKAEWATIAGELLTASAHR